MDETPAAALSRTLTGVPDTHPSTDVVRLNACIANNTQPTWFGRCNQLIINIVRTELMTDSPPTHRPIRTGYSTWVSVIDNIMSIGPDPQGPWSPVGSVSGSIFPVNNPTGQLHPEDLNWSTVGVIGFRPSGRLFWIAFGTDAPWHRWAPPPFDPQGRPWHNIASLKGKVFAAISASGDVVVWGSPLHGAFADGAPKKIPGGPFIDIVSFTGPPHAILALRSWGPPAIIAPNPAPVRALLQNAV